MAKTADLISENFFEAIQTIINAELKNISYDKTIVCTVTKDDKRSEGQYTVTDGSVEFDAYSETTEYRVGDEVLVTILLGDFSQAKTIVRRYTKENASDPVVYVPPLGTMLDMTDNLTLYGAWLSKDAAGADLNAGEPYSILANGPTNYKCIWAIDFDADTNNAGLEIKENSIYSVIGLKASFKTLLGAKDYNIRDGEYGLMLYVEYTSLPGQSNEHSALAKFVLDSRHDMFGDPYNFQTYFVQEKKIDISKLGTIHKMNLFLYLTGNFAYHDGEHKDLIPLPHTTTLNGKEIDLPDNIWVTNISLSFGYDIISMNDNEFKLYTTDGPTFSPKRVNDPYNEKSIYTLWCNKDINNEYVGFSDGIYDPEYDEDTYLREFKAKLDALTLKNLTMESKCPPILEALLIYSNANKLNDVYLKIADYYTSNIAELLRYLRANLEACGIETEQIDKLVPMYSADNNLRSKLQSAFSSISAAANLRSAGTGIRPEQSSRMVAREYLAWFDALYQKYGTDEYYFDGNVLVRDPYTYAINQYTNNSTGVLDTWSAAKKEIKDMYSKLTDDSELINVKPYIEKSSMNMEEVFINIENLIGTINDYLQPIYEELIMLQERFLHQDLRNIDEEYTMYVAANENKYCIYWYRYDKTVKTSNDNYKGQFWKRFTDFGLQGGNGLPNAHELNETDGLEYYAKRPTDAENGPREIRMDTSVALEQFQAVVIYNHLPHYSNIISFDNEEPIIDTTTADATDSIYIELGDKAQASYLLYGVDNVLQNIADRSVSRLLRLRYKGQDWGDEALIGTTVFWYIPTNATMLSWKEDLENQKTELETTYKFTQLSKLWNEEENPDYSNAPDDYKNYRKYIRPGYECWYKIIQPDPNRVDEFGQSVLNEFDTYFYYTIKDYFNPTATQNTIRVLVLKDLAELETEYSFSFATFGTSGTDYSVVVHPSGSQTSVIHITTEDNVDTELHPMPLTVEFYDYDNKPVEINWNPAPDSGQRVPTIASLKRSSLNIIPYGDATKGNFMIDMVPTYKPTANPPAFGNLYTVIEATIPWDTLGVNKMADGENEPILADLSLDLKALYAVPYSAGYYYMEGPSTIVYDSDGKNPMYYKDTFKLYNQIDDTEIDGVDWDLLYFQELENGNLSYVNLSLDISDDTERRRRKQILQFLPTIVKNDQKNGYILNPVHMYINNLDYYCVLVASKRNKLLYSLPIIIMLNRYSSSMINKWDESLVLDEENGTILSTMVGAGSKDDLNRFSGVLMGDVRTGTDDATLDMIGIYGFHEGALSFGLKADGTAFLGKSGLGRIVFNGNDGYILNSTFLYTVNGHEYLGAGMRIDLNDGIITMRGTKENDDRLTNYTNSEIILLTKTPYFTIRDEGHYTLSTEDWTPELANIDFYEKYIDKTDSSHPVYKYKNVRRLNSTLYRPGYFYYKDNGLYLMWIGEEDYYLRSHNFPDSKTLSSQYHIVDLPTANDFDNYYVRVNELTLDSSNILPTVDGDAPTIQKYYILENGKPKEVRMRPRNEFTNRRGIDLYTSMLLDINSVVTNNRLYYTKDDSDRYNAITVNFDFYEPNTYYYADPKLPYKFWLCTRLEYDGRETYYATPNLNSKIEPEQMVLVDPDREDEFYDLGYYYLDTKSDTALATPEKLAYTLLVKLYKTYELLLAEYGLVTLYTLKGTVTTYKQVTDNSKLGKFILPESLWDKIYTHEYGPVCDMEDTYSPDRLYHYYPNNNSESTESGYDIYFNANWSDYETWYVKRGESYIEVDGELIQFNPDLSNANNTLYLKIADAEYDENGEELEPAQYERYTVYYPGYYWYTGDVWTHIVAEKNKTLEQTLKELPIGGTYYYQLGVNNYVIVELWYIDNEALSNVYVEAYYLYTGPYVVSQTYYRKSGENSYYYYPIGPTEFATRLFDLYTKGYDLYTGQYNPDLTYYDMVVELQFDEVDKGLINSYLINAYLPNKFYLYVLNLKLDDSKINRHEEVGGYYNLYNEYEWRYEPVEGTGTCIRNPYEPSRYYYNTQYNESPPITEKEITGYVTLIPNDDNFLGDTPYFLPLGNNGTLVRVYFYENGTYYIYALKYKRANEVQDYFTGNTTYYTRWGGTGLKIDLLHGTLEGYNIKFEAHGTYNPVNHDNRNDGIIKPEEGDFIIDTTVPEETGYPLKLGNNFKVSWSGYMLALSGNIGGWTIFLHRLESNSGQVGMADFSSDLNSSGIDGNYEASKDAPVFWATSQVQKGNTNLYYTPYSRPTIKTLNNSYYESNGDLNDVNPIGDWLNQLDFYVTRNGHMKANKGIIAGWTIKPDGLYSPNGSVKLLSNGRIEGAHIETTSGHIGGWEIREDGLYSPSGNVYLTNSGTIHGATITGSSVSCYYLNATSGYISGLSGSNCSFNGGTFNNGTFNNATMNTGTIGGFTFLSGTITSGNLSLNTAGTLICLQIRVNGSGMTVSGYVACAGYGNFSDHVWAPEGQFDNLTAGGRTVATQYWVQDQGYLTSHLSLAAYATRMWVSDNFSRKSHTHSD